MASPAAELSFSFLLLLSAADAANNIDINKILGAYPGFSDFNKLLTQTGVAYEINQQPSCTVLVVDNAHMSELSGLSPDAEKNTLSLQVVLEYYDETKLRNMNFKRPLLLTTLYQQSGKAQHHQGFLKMKTEGSGQVAFGSAAPGSYLDTTFVKQIVTVPDRVSELQVSDIINGTRASSNSASPASLPKASSPRKALTLPLAPAAAVPSLVETPALSPITPTELPGAPASAPAPSDASVGYEDYVASTILTVSLGLGFFLL
ncbi:fasciclin-like arabinogalactan protein 14 [Hibiscus syriacus]|nr:fasciclin-like arabinogalactan protein 14 [Hibiscus syriacus]